MVGEVRSLPKGATAALGALRRSGVRRFLRSVAKVLPGSGPWRDWPGMTNHADSRRLREARRALRAAVCTCGPEHDEWWALCPRTLATWARDDAIAPFLARNRR